MSVVAALQEWMVKRQKTLILAESCTGGFLSHQITSLPGASAYFLGSFVTYATALKHKILKVPQAVLQEESAVGEKTVRAMLEGALLLSKADFGLAVSGFAGPEGGTKKDPVGTVYAAFGSSRELRVERLEILGERSGVIEGASEALLAHLYEYLQTTEKT